MTYAEKLRDPRWQKLRLEILSRDNWTCQMCESTTTTLNVHHIVYHSGADPWEYNPRHLLTLCQTCHEEEPDKRSRYEAALLASLRESGMDTAALCGLAAIFGTTGMQIEWTGLRNWTDFSYALFWLMLNEPEQMRGALWKFYEGLVGDADEKPVVADDAVACGELDGGSEDSPTHQA